MVLLGVDFGDVRVGFARCDKDELLATGLETVNVAGVRDAAKKTALKAAEIGAEKIVVGKPLRTDGSAGDRVEKTLAFVQMLSDLVQIPVETFDERFTSVCAHQYLSGSGLKTKKHKGLVDTVSAAIILQDYMDRHKNR